LGALADQLAGAVERLAAAQEARMARAVEAQ
jgi:hypothetical protein